MKMTKRSVLRPIHSATFSYATNLRQAYNKLFCVNQTYNLLTTVVHVTKNVIGF